MLIIDQQLDIEEFKKFYKDINWLKVPRKLSKDNTEFFYIGIYEDNEWLIKASIRPSMRMQLSESYKRCDKSGKRVDKSYKGRLYQFGTTIEVLVDNSFLDKIKKVAKIPSENKIQKVTW